MSFAAIRSIATSSLMATQAQMQVTSSNIANADVTGYTKKTATQVATVTGTAVSGTSVTAVTSDVDKYLLRDLVAAASTLGAATVTDAKADALQNLFGSTTGTDSGGTSLASAIDSLDSALTSLSGTIESSTLKSLAIDSLDALASQLRETSSSVQGLRADSDGEIADAVASANEAIGTIDTLNEQIVTAKAKGESTADLEDKRNTALQTLSTLMNVSYLVKANGEMRVSTGSGTVLVDGSAHTLSYSPAAAVTADTVFDAITVDGKAVTDEITSGTIGALLEQRDVALPATMETLDTLASTLASTLNAAYNAGSSLPPPTTLTGITAASASTALEASGTLRVALTSSDGSLSSHADLDLSSYATVGDLVTALNGIDGITASVATGTLVISSSDTTLGVAVADTGGSVGSSGQGFSDFFGLNDLMTGVGAADIGVRADLLSGATGLATATLSTDAGVAAGDTVISSSSAFVATLQAALENDISFDASGDVAAMTTTLAGYAASVVSAVATNATQATTSLDTTQTIYDSYSDAMTSATGVNVDEETARMSELEQQYSTAAQLLAVLSAMYDALLAAAKA